LSKTITLDEIKQILPSIDLVPIIEQGFVAYSEKRCVVPPVGELTFEDPPADVHIKYGYIQNDNFYIIKIASGFYDNPKQGLASSNGLMLLFSAKTGELVATLLDQGELTDVRTGIAGAIAAKHLAPKVVKQIGLVGTGTQARMQLRYLAPTSECRKLQLLGRSDVAIDSMKKYAQELGYEVTVANSAEAILNNCNLVVTTTPSTSPLLNLEHYDGAGLHITAVGSDTAEKQELSEQSLRRADLVVADSCSQCESRGEIHHAIEAGLISTGDIVELGRIINGSAAGRQNDQQISICDLTGVAVQDIQIAKAVYSAI
jgi:ornithine cyclodeaminase